MSRIACSLEDLRALCLQLRGGGGGLRRKKARNKEANNEIKKEIAKESKNRNRDERNNKEITMYRKKGKNHCYHSKPVLQAWCLQLGGGGGGGGGAGGCPSSPLSQPLRCFQLHAQKPACIKHIGMLSSPVLRGKNLGNM